MNKLQDSFLTLKGIWKYSRFLKRSQSFSNDEIITNQSKWLSRLLVHAHKNIPWYSTLPHSKVINEWILQQAGSKRVRNAFILQNESGSDGMPDLSKSGIKFPADYILCGQLNLPGTGEWVRLWRPKRLT